MFLGLTDLVEILREKFKRRPKRRTRKRHLDAHIREAEVRILLSGTPGVDSRSGDLDLNDPWDDSHYFTAVGQCRL